MHCFQKVFQLNHNQLLYNGPMYFVCEHDPRLFYVGFFFLHGYSRKVDSCYILASCGNAVCCHCLMEGKSVLVGLLIVLSNREHCSISTCVLNASFLAGSWTSSELPSTSNLIRTAWPFHQLECHCGVMSLHHCLSLSMASISGLY